MSKGLRSPKLVHDRDVAKTFGGRGEPILIVASKVFMFSPTEQKRDENGKLKDEVV